MWSVQNAVCVIAVQLFLVRAFYDVNGEFYRRRRELHGRRILAKKELCAEEG